MVGQDFQLRGNFGASATDTKIMRLPSYLTQQGLAEAGGWWNSVPSHCHTAAKVVSRSVGWRIQQSFCIVESTFSWEVSAQDRVKTQKWKLRVPVWVDQGSTIKLKHHKLCAFEIKRV